MSAKAAYYDTGFGLTARGGADQSYTLDYVNGVGLGSYADYEAIRPQKTANLDANYFFSGLGGNNELKFGFGYRTVTTDSGSSYNGNQLVGVINGTGAGDRVAKVFRNRRVVNGGKYWSGYLGDVLTGPLHRQRRPAPRPPDGQEPRRARCPPTPPSRASCPA